MFKRRRIKRIKDIMVDSAKNNPDKLTDCPEYMIVYLKAQDRVIFMPRDYAGLSDCEIDAAIWRRHTAAV